MTRTTLSSVCMLFLAACAQLASGDNDICYYDNSRTILVHSSNCPHDCCVNDVCGSSSECKAAIAVGLIILFVLLGVCCVAITVGVMCCTQTGCFRPRVSSTTTYVASTGLTTGMPVAAQYPVAAYPPPGGTPLPGPYAPPLQQPYVQHQQPYVQHQQPYVQHQQPYEQEQYGGHPPPVPSAMAERDGVACAPVYSPPPALPTAADRTEKQIDVAN